MLRVLAVYGEVDGNEPFVLVCRAVHEGNVRWQQTPYAIHNAVQ